MTLAPPLSPSAGWTEINAPILYKWEKPGQELIGVLTAIEQVTIEGKRVTQFTLEEAGQRFKLLAVYDLMQKITRTYVGCRLHIRYLGEDESVKGGANGTPMKRFSVLFKGTPSSANPDRPITDEDIPF